MSDEPEAFLARWSKRKAQARATADVADAPPAGRLGGVDAPELAETAADASEEIPLEELPPIESIDASTDLSPWLKKKLPPAWKQAALRRVWAADPAISQFTGLIEYGWDWNTPGGVPGGGPLRASDNVAQLLAQAIGQTLKTESGEIPETTALSEAPEADAAHTEHVEPASTLPTEQAVGTALPEEKTAVELVTEAADPIESGEISHADYNHKIVRKRRGGGALPA